MKIIINTTSMVPIYEQIIGQIKKLMCSGELKAGDILPSVRTLSKELKISALTVKKTYDILESEGFVVSVHGKGTFVRGINPDIALEEAKKDLETDIEQVIKKAKNYGINTEDLKDIFNLILEDLK